MRKVSIENISTGLEGLEPVAFEPESIKRLAMEFRKCFVDAKNVQTEDLLNVQDNLERLEKLLRKTKFDFVVDGANVGYFSNRRFTKDNILKVLTHLANLANQRKKRYNVLIVFR